MKKNSFQGIVKAVIDYLGNECEFCGSKERLLLHHILPLSKGGNNNLGNLQVVCIKCHPKIHRQLEKIFPTKKLLKEITCSICGESIKRIINIENSICKNCKARKRNEYYKKCIKL